MPYGKGTYGSKVGRPSKRKSLQSKGGASRRKAREMAKLKAATGSGAITQDEARHMMKKLASKSAEPGYKKLSKYKEKSSPTLGKGGYQAESEKMNALDARKRSKKSY